MTTAKRLYPAARSKGRRSACICLSRKTKRVAKSCRTAEALALEARSVAQARVAGDQEIRRLLGQTFLDKGVERPYTLSDIVVSVQARTHVSLFLQTLLEEGIEAVSDASAEILTTQECGALIQVLRVVDSLQDDIDFVTALRSPVGRMHRGGPSTHSRLYQKEQQRMGTLSDRCEFLQAARHFSAHGKGATADRLRRFFERHPERYRQYAHRHSVGMHACSISMTTATPWPLLAYNRMSGLRKTENLIALWQRAQGYAQSGDGSLYGFLQTLDTHHPLRRQGTARPAHWRRLCARDDHAYQQRAGIPRRDPSIFLEQGLARADDTSLPLSKTSRHWALAFFISDP